MMTIIPDAQDVVNRSPLRRERPSFRSVALPSEHGGWGLTAEPIVLGLVVAFSAAGVAIGLAALLAFLVRTPLKLVLVDRRRSRLLDRTRLARRIATWESAAIAGFAIAATAWTGWFWLVPIAIATPCIGIELWYDVRSRGRRLVPEVSGSIGIASVAAAIVVAANGSAGIAAGVWLILAARATASIPFIRAQIDRLRHGAASLFSADVLQVVAIAVAVIAVMVEPSMIIGAIAVGLLTAVQAVWMRHSFLPPAKVLGVTQMVFGLIVVAATAIGVLTLA